MTEQLLSEERMRDSFNRPYFEKGHWFNSAMTKCVRCGRAGIDLFEDYGYGELGQCDGEKMAPLKDPPEWREGDARVWYVKSWPQFFQPMLEGVKKHDMRNRKDRDYRVGDLLVLREFDPFGGGYTGRLAKFRITYMTDRTTPCALSSAMLDDDAVILSLEKVDEA